MAEVRPLCGFRYDPEKVGELAQVVTPPFDIISKEAQAHYYARNPHNVIRLELTQEKPTDGPLDNVYTRAAATFATWRLEEVLRQDSRAGYYMYQQKFSYGGQSYTRMSLMARVRLEPWDARVVLPHEHTLAKAKEDRLNLLRACSANFSPIMCMYDDPQGRIRRLLNSYAPNAEVQIVDEDKVEHRLQPIIDEEQINLIQNFFAQRQLYIADGHHRYTTALHYRDEIRAQRAGLAPDDGVNFVLMALIDLDDPGMLVLPTHRLLSGLSEEALNKLSAKMLARYFSVQSLEKNMPHEAILKQLEQAGREQPSLVIHLPEQSLLLTLNEQGRRRMTESEHSAAWNQLDVAIAQMLVLEDLLGISAEDMAAGKYVRYTHDEEQLFQAVQRGEAQAALILNATPLRQVCDVAQADDRMPQKSTYIYPKLISGLVINPLW